jgi:hypothetical protein
MRWPIIIPQVPAALSFGYFFDIKKMKKAH